MNHLLSVFVLSGVGVFTLWLGTHLHFFRFISLPQQHLKLRYPIWGFLGYLFTFFVLAPLSLQFLGSTLKDVLRDSPALMLTVLQLLAFLWSATFLILYSFLQERQTLKGIWIHKARRQLFTFFKDFGLGIIAWIIAFPVVAAIGQLVDFITYLITGKMTIDQLAIQYLRLVKTSPSLLTIALFTILIAAPILEELAFRGFLYTFLREKWGLFWAMVSSSLLFAIFHFSPEQGIGNIPLIATLFTLALFLVFIYERQRSLTAPIALHMTFNSISVMRILLISN